MAITVRDSGYDVRLGRIKTKENATELGNEIGQMMVNAEQIKANPDLSTSAMQREWRKAVDAAQARVVSTVQSWITTADEVVRGFQNDLSLALEEHERGLDFARLSFVSLEIQARIENASAVDNPLVPYSDVRATVINQILGAGSYYEVRALRAVSLPEQGLEATDSVFAYASQRMVELEPPKVRTLREYTDEAIGRRRELRDQLDLVGWKTLTQVSQKGVHATLAQDWPDLAAILGLKTIGFFDTPAGVARAVLPN